MYSYRRPQYRRITNTARTFGYNKRIPQQQARMMPRSGLSECAMNYCVARYNPWANFSVAPCVPDSTPQNTLKRSYVIRGTAVSNGAGCAIIAMNPYNSIYAGPTSGYSGVTNVYFSAPLFVSSFAAATNGQNYKPYAYGDPNSTAYTGDGVIGRYFPVEYGQDDDVDLLWDKSRLDWRVVAAGIRWQYNGKAEDRAGNVAFFTSNTNAAIQTSNNITPDSLALQDQTQWLPVDEKTHSIVWHPRQNDDLEFVSAWATGYTNSPQTNATVGGTIAFPSTFVLQAPLSFELGKYMTTLVMFNNMTPGSTINYEAIVHLEIAGTDLQGKTTEKPDPSGAAAANADSPTRPPITPAPVQAKVAVEKAKKNLQYHSKAGPWNKLLSYAGAGIGTAAEALLRAKYPNAMKYVPQGLGKPAGKAIYRQANAWGRKIGKSYRYG